MEHASKDTDPRFLREEIASLLARAARPGRDATGPDRQARIEPGILARRRPVRARAFQRASLDTAGRRGADPQERTPRGACGVDAAETSNESLLPKVALRSHDGGWWFREDPPILTRVDDDTRRKVVAIDGKIRPRKLGFRTNASRRAGMRPIVFPTKVSVVG